MLAEGRVGACGETSVRSAMVGKGLCVRRFMSLM